MLILIPSLFSRPVKASLVNWLPWSVLKISGFSFPERASSSASMQKEVSMVIDSFQASTRRLNQSTTAAREREQPPHVDAWETDWRRPYGTLRVVWAGVPSVETLG